MTEKKPNKTIINSVLLDLLYSMVIGVMLTFFSYYVNLFPLTNDALSMFITFFGTLLGFTVTALTILFMFNPKDNDILRRIKENGFYGQIFERYLSTIKVLLASTIILIPMSFLLKPLNENYPFLSPYLLFVFISIVVLSFLRIYRCITLLSDICDILQ